MKRTYHNLDLEKQTIHNILTYRFRGRFNAQDAMAVKQTIIHEIESNNHYMLLDLTQMDFIDSSGLGVLVTCLRAAQKNGGNLKLSGLNNELKQVFNLVKFDNVFELYDDIEEAANSFHEKT